MCPPDVPRVMEEGAGGSSLKFRRGTFGHGQHPVALTAVAGRQRGEQAWMWQGPGQQAWDGLASGREKETERKRIKKGE